MMSLDAARYSSGLSCAAAIARGGGVRALFLGLTYAAYHPYLQLRLRTAAPISYIHRAWPAYP